MRARGWMIGFVLLMTGTAWGDEIALVSEGASPYVIHVEENASAAEVLAAEEVAQYVEGMTGARLPMQRGGDVPARAIVISVDETLRKGRPGEAFAIESNDAVIRIRGDRGRSVLRGAYQFLDQLGCRFLAPELGHYGGAAEEVPKKRTLSFPRNHAVRSSAALAFRKLYVEEGLSHDAASLRQIVEWMPKAGFNTLVVPTDYQGTGRVRWDNWREALTPELKKRDLIIEVGGHGYQNFLNVEMQGGRLFREHPEWFGQDEEGVRQRARGRVFCTSNVEAVNFVMNGVLDYVERRPEIEVFDLWPPDGARWCECGECREVGSPTERQAILVNLVRSVAARARPGVRIECLAYSTSIVPPERSRLHEDVLLDFCPIAQSFEAPIFDPGTARNVEYAKGLKAWRERFDGDISLYSYYRRYAWDSLPVMLPAYMKEEITFYLTIPVQGISTYAEPGDWFTYELNHYVLGALAWEPGRDVDEIVDRFCDARYGPTSGPAKRALMLLAETTRTFGGVPYVTLKGAGEIESTRKRVRGAANELGAVHIPEGASEVSRSVGRLMLMLGYAERDLVIQRMRAEQAPEESIREGIDDLHRWLVQHKGRGVFLTERLTPSRTLRRYGISAGR